MPSPPPPQAHPSSDEARILGGLLNKTTYVRLVWSEDDYGPMLRHQLDARLADDLRVSFPDEADTIAEAGGLTFGELLLHPRPPVGALRLVKTFAKRLNRQAHSAYPEDVATALYFASIAAARLHARVAITSLPRDALHKGWRWAAERAWIPDELKRLFARALEEES